MARNPGGKKVGFYEFSTEAARHKVELRLNTSTGDFHAEYMGERFEDKDLTKLKAKIFAETKKRSQITYEPVIRIEVKGADRGGHSYRGDQTDCVGLDFELQYHAIVDEEKWYKPGYVEEGKKTGSFVPEMTNNQPQRVWREQEYSYVPWSPQRWENLVKIQDAINELRKRLRAVLHEAGADQVQALLDGLVDGGLKLLTEPAKKEKAIA